MGVIRCTSKRIGFVFVPQGWQNKVTVSLNQLRYDVEMWGILDDYGLL